MRGPARLIAALLIAATPAAGQIQPDFTQIGQAVNGLAFPVTMNMCNAGFCGAQGEEGQARLRKAPAAVRGQLAATRPAPAGTPVGIGTYQPTDALARRSLAAYVARIGRTDRKAAESLAREFTRHDYRTTYKMIVGDMGLRTDSVSDAMAAYFMLSWVIANQGSSDPTPAQTQGLRRQFAARAAAAPEVLANRAMMGEELKLLVVTLHAGMQSAQREGQKASYARDVADMVQRRYGVDLRRLRLGAQGFEQA